MAHIHYSQENVRILPNRWDGIALLLLASIIAFTAYGAMHMSLPFKLGETMHIQSHPSALIPYSLLTCLRMFIALVFSFLATFIIAPIAAKSAKGEQIIIPIIDILQSVPILGYLSIFVPFFIGLFPGSMVGPEAAVIFVIFTSQVWNMILSFYQSLKTIPSELQEATEVYQLSPWQKFWRLEVPYAMPGLLWNAMMSMSAGWFFIVASEAISIANQTITLPGVGSYIALAIENHSIKALWYSIIAMLIVITLYDQIFFRPLVAWSKKFTLSEAEEEEASSWVLVTLQRTALLQYLGQYTALIGDWIVNNRFLIGHAFKKKPKKAKFSFGFSIPSWLQNLVWYGLMLLICIWAAMKTTAFFQAHISWQEVLHVNLLSFYTFLRVSILLLLCSIIWVPIGIWTGLNPKAARIVQPLAQFAAAFPANLFFPLFVILVTHFKLNFEIYSAPIMILGTQWYILFNVIAGATAIPKELKLAASNMQLKGLLKWRKYLIPAIMPYFITGLITAAGGSWNASIVAEIIQWGHQELIAQGLGSYITIATNEGNFAQIALGVIIMCLWVTIINIIFWRPIYRLATKRYQLGT